jgi:hypothetical protein
MNFNEFTKHADMLAHLAGFARFQDMEALNVANKPTYLHLQQILNQERHVHHFIAERDVVIVGVKIRYPTREESRVKFLQEQERMLAMHRGNMKNRKAPIVFDC